MWIVILSKYTTKTCKVYISNMWQDIYVYYTITCEYLFIYIASIWILKLYTKKKKKNINEREGLEKYQLVVIHYFLIFFFFLSMKKRWHKMIVSTKIIRNNVCLWGVQRLKAVSFEHNCHNYTYPKKKKVTTFWKKETFFFGWKVSRKHSPFKKIYFNFWKHLI